MNKFNVVAASAVALSAALASGSALAHGTLAVTTANYNAASVAAAGGTITVPWGGSAAAVYTVSANNSVTTSLEVNSRFTVSLPSGFTFGSAPAITVSNGESMVLLNGGIGQQTATFVVSPNQAPIPQGTTLSLGQTSVQGATALETPNSGLQITVQSTNNSLVSNNDLTPVSPSNAVANVVQQTFTSDSGVLAAFTNGTGNAIDLTSPSLGTLFTVGGTDTATVDIGTITLTSSNSLGANGQPVTALSTSDTASITINGFFNGIASAGAVPFGGGSIVSAGTVTASTITIPALPAGTGVNVGKVIGDIVLTANGTTLLQQNGTNFPASGFTAAYAPTSGTADFLGGTASNTQNHLLYTGGQLVGGTDFLTGSDAGYTSLVRLTNGGTSANELFAIAQPYSGGTPLVGSLGTIGAGMGTVFTEAQIGTATGLSLANSGERATLQIIAIPGTNVSASGLLVNPGGVVDNVN